MLRHALKKVIWLGNSRKRIQGLPEVAKDIAGEELMRVQKGENPVDWRPMPDIAFGVKEIRIHNPDEYRIFYIASYAEAIYILNVFGKTTKKTTQQDKQLGKARYAILQKLRKEQETKTGQN